MDAIGRGRSRREPHRETRFFGREADIAALEAVLRDRRLLTLVGAPGCGKTRLGIELAARSAHRYRDRLCFVDLAPVTVDCPGAVTSAVGAALKLRERPGRDARHALIEALADKELLLVLNDCEHVARAAGSLVTHLLGCRSVRILATSRLSLGIEGEQVWPVPPLDPAAAIQLLRDRAQLVRPGPGDAIDGAVAEDICRRLDGLPLAIELAAKRTRVLHPTEIVERLERGIPLVGEATRGSTAWHHSMQGAVERSYRLLAPDARDLFARLSVFAGGFDLDAVHALTGEPDALAPLTALLDHSLVQAEPSPDAAMRYRLLEPVRQCGEIRLARPERDRIRRRHAEHYADVARRAGGPLDAAARARALRRMDLEEANFDAALGWALAHAPDLGLKLCVALAPWWELRGRVRQGRQWFVEMLTRATSDVQLPAAAVASAARLAVTHRDHGTAEASPADSFDLGHRVTNGTCTPSQLSQREREVAELAADGLTNAEVAQTLCISRRTVESHVEHIKQKLNLRRRAHIVAWVLRLRSPDASFTQATGQSE